MKSMCLSTTFIMSLATVVILFCIERPLVAGYQKIKQNEGTKYEVKICKSPSRKKRKRVLTDQNFLQPPEKARSFLRKSTITYVTNYPLFYEECCIEGCRKEEVLEHCVVSYK
ncbi:unnamed protein product [Porites evermanni]|uniref:Uncharacterized protein n=1 Tax=Porites evermanni TaxID=104178 RepID=A0ABN8M2X8_9CNID|nr:unnamed protein product [Porites evermanni]